MGCVELEVRGEIPIFKVENKVKDGEMHLRTCTTVKKNELKLWEWMKITYNRSTEERK